jgi:2'-5' RNA ligase
MNYFLGFFLDDKSRKQVVKSVGNISTIFSGMGIEVRWIKPSHYHIEIQKFEGNVGLLRQLYISYRIKRFLIKRFDISLGRVKLGVTKRMRGLLYIEIDQGGDLLRELRYNLLNTLKIKDNVQFIPHIAIGRINKDLSRQEISNITKDMENIFKKTNHLGTELMIKEIDLIKNKDTYYEIVKKFEINS